MPECAPDAGAGAVPVRPLRRSVPMARRESSLGGHDRRLAEARALLREEGSRALPDLRHGRRSHRRRIRVNCAAVGTAETPWVARFLDPAPVPAPDPAPDPAAERAALATRQPMGRLVSADEAAAAIAYLASPLASATTGTVLALDGGMSGLRLRPPGQSGPSRHVRPSGTSGPPARHVRPARPARPPGPPGPPARHVRPARPPGTSGTSGTSG